MGKFNGKRVLISGGASGIGRIMGAMALEKGAEAVVIWDINHANFDNTLAEFAKLGRAVGYRVDVADKEMVAQGYAAVKR